MFRFILFCALLTCFACGSNDTPSTTPSTTTPTPSATSPRGENLYPSITMDEMQNLWNSTTAIDYIFYELPISMNMTERPAIESTLRQISDEPARIFSDCKAMGRIFFQNNGNPLAEADFYFSPKCTYFVFIENQKPVKSNQMTAEGIQFFKNILTSSTNHQ